jgi:hypothetical protein
LPGYAESGVIGGAVADELGARRPRCDLDVPLDHRADHARPSSPLLTPAQEAEVESISWERYRFFRFLRLDLLIVFSALLPTQSGTAAAVVTLAFMVALAGAMSSVMSTRSGASSDSDSLTSSSRQISVLGR